MRLEPWKWRRGPIFDPLGQPSSKCTWRLIFSNPRNSAYFVLFFLPAWKTWNRTCSTQDLFHKRRFTFCLGWHPCCKQNLWVRKARNSTIFGDDASVDIGVFASNFNLLEILNIGQVVLFLASSGFGFGSVTNRVVSSLSRVFVGGISLIFLQVETPAAPWVHRVPPIR